MDNQPEDTPRTALATRIAAGWLLGLLGLGGAVWVGDIIMSAADIGPRSRQVLQAVVMSGIVVPGVILLRRRLDRAPVSGMGLPGARRSLRDFAAGAGIVGVPLLLALVAAQMMGWASVVLDLSMSGLGTLAYLVFTALVFEALPEELVFRGYIYRNLSSAFSRRLASLATVALFVLLPVALFVIQTYVLGMETQFGGSSGLTADYLVIMVLFGSFVQYIRVLSGAVWMGIGFHFGFLLLNRVMGPRPSNLIHVTEVAGAGPLQAMALSLAGLTILAALAWPFVTRRSLRWGAVDPEPGTA
jgi:membrane protease YdiL (CAAX protease family)